MTRSLTVSYASIPAPEYTANCNQQNPIRPTKEADQFFIGPADVVVMNVAATAAESLRKSFVGG